MKIATLGSQSETYGVRGSNRVTFESNATAFYAQISGLSEDKIGYPIRELSSNAWDAAGQNVEISLPTELNPVFAIRDYGPGLSHAFMTTRFTVMYHSDKRESLDKIGGWGLGRFSPFAYLLSDESSGFYLITSRHEGVKTDYLMSLDEDGTPSLNTMNSGPCEDPSGLEVSFSVNARDIKAFQDKAREILWAFPQRPTVTPDLGFVDYPPVIQGSNWALLPEGVTQVRGPAVRIGCVMYHINMAHPSIVNPAPTMIRDTTRLLFETAIDSVQPTLSREDLEYNSRTINTINVLLQTYYDEVIGSIQTRIDGAQTLFEADRIYRQATDGFIDRENHLRTQVRWRGREIPRVFNPNDVRRFCLLPVNWSLAEVDKFDGGEILAPQSMAGATIVIEHTVGQSLRKLEAAGLVGRRLLWIRCRAVDRARVLTEIGDPDGVINLSDYRVEETETRPKTLRRRSMMTFGVAGMGERQTIEIDLAVPQYYVIVDRHNRYHHTYSSRVGGRQISQHALSTAVMKAHRLGCFTAREVIHVCPLASDQAIPENWNSFIDQLIGLLRPHLTQNETHNWANYRLQDFPNEIHWLRGQTEAPFRHLGGDLGAAYTRFLEIANGTADAYAYGYHRGQPRTDSVYNILSDLGATLESHASHNIQALVQSEVKAIMSRYPLLSKISESGYARGDQSNRILLMREYERLLVLDARYGKGRASQGDTPEVLDVP